MQEMRCFSVIPSNVPSPVSTKPRVPDPVCTSGIRECKSNQKWLLRSDAFPGKRPLVVLAVADSAIVSRLMF
jgi:hypothetical protein